MPTRIVAALELVLIVMPTTVLALWGAGAIFSSRPTGEMLAFGSALVVALVATGGVWRLLVPLMRGRTRSALAAAPFWWFSVWAGGMFVICATLLSLVASWRLELSDASRSMLGSVAVVAFFGLPMLIPLAHLAVERVRDMRSNKRLQATRPEQSAPET